MLQKLKANGYNAVSFYFDWGYHSSKQGAYDFTGVRDMDVALTMAQEAGLYVIARLDEARQQRSKLSAMKELGLFLQSVPPVTKMDKSTTVTPSTTAVKVYHNVNPDTQTHLYVATHNPSSATTIDAFTFPVSTPDGSFTVPQSGSLQLSGQDAKMLVANLNFGGQHLVYSTSEIETRSGVQANGDRVEEASHSRDVGGMDSCADVGDRRAGHRLSSASLVSAEAV